MSRIETPVWQKVNLTIQEAASLFNIGEKRLRVLVKKPNDYTLMLGRKTLIRRVQFEHWLETQYVI